MYLYSRFFCSRTAFAQEGIIRVLEGCSLISGQFKISCIVICHHTEFSDNKKRHPFGWRSCWQRMRDLICIFFRSCGRKLMCCRQNRCRARLAPALIGHCCKENVLASTPIRAHPQGHGFSHGLKTVPRTVFTPVCPLVPPFRIPQIRGKIKTPPKWVVFLFWQRMRDSNPRKRSQSPVCYRYTNPLCGALKHGYYYTYLPGKVKKFFPLFENIFPGQH